jgi:uncharacterized damage-inducible protein DinB
MPDLASRLAYVYDGWDGYHRSIVNAVAPLTVEQLAFKGSPDMRSVGELALHIADGRVDWFRRIGAPGAGQLWDEMESRPLFPVSNPAKLVEWLERTWRMVAAGLAQWTIEDLAFTYEQPYQGKVYAVSRQWTIWRIMAHDIHHGGQLSELLAMQGILPVDLTLLGGHLTEPPVITS